MRRLKWLFAACAIVVLGSCGSDDEPSSNLLPFNMERQAEVIEGYSTKQAVYSGNGDYRLTVRDASIATASYVSSYGGVDFGAVVLTGLKQGSTVLTVSDVKADKSIDIDVKVVSPNFYMLTPVTSNHKALTRKVVQCFIPSEKTERDVLFFESDGVGLRYLTRGSYHTESPADGPTQLVMSYPTSPSDSTLVTTANVAPTPHRFVLNNASTALITILNATAPIPETQQPGTAAIEMTEDITQWTVKGNIVYGPQFPLVIPFGYLP